MPAAECGLTYRNSIFKHRDRYAVLEVTLAAASGSTAMSEPIRYAELARALGVEVGERAGLADVRAGGARRCGAAKGMLIDPADPDSRSAGSFFTNPVLTPQEYAAGVRASRGRAALVRGAGRPQGPSGVADRAGRLRQGLGRRPGRHLERGTRSRWSTAAAGIQPSC